MRRSALQSLRVIVAGMFLAAGLGWVAFYVRLGQPLARLSYDMMFLFRSANLDTSEIQLVDIDEASSGLMSQRRDGILSRDFHARLLRRLTQEGARAVLFDVIFHTPSEAPGIDEDFADAIKENGRVFLAAFLVVDDDPNHLEVAVQYERVFGPIPMLRQAAQDWGLVTVSLHPGQAVRTIHPGTEQTPAATWKLAKFLGADLPGDYAGRCQTRWINYYGPAGTIPHVQYSQTLQADGLAAGFFKDKVVLIGGRGQLATLGKTDDKFADPWTRWGGSFMAGVEVHANTLLNLLHESWFIRGEPRTEGTLIVIAGIVVGGLFARLRPLAAAITGTACAVAILWGALWWLDHRHVWYNWLIPVAVQIPVAIAWSWAANSFLERRIRAEMTREAGIYVPKPVMDQIAKGKPVDTTPIVVEATMIFTDLHNSSGIAEALADPAAVQQVVNEYLSGITRSVGANHGTVLRIQGDGVFAAWGVPASDRNHPTDAVAAAWGVCELSQREILGHRLITRIGINTGAVSAGTVGSKTRGEYTLTGDPVNLAARLETLNKHLGTAALMSGATHAKLGGHFPTRCLGEFIVVGKKAAITVHELLGPADQFAGDHWLEAFEQALAAFQRGDLSDASILFREVQKARGGTDGPSEFYLDRIEKAEKSGLPDDWSGVVEMSAK